MKRLLLLGSQHGNELLGDALYSYIKMQRQELLPHISYLVGNPRAKKTGVRYVQTDLNRSYTGQSKTYEQRRAKRILKHIATDDFDLVLDLHTTTCETPPCLITSPNISLVAPFIRASSIDKLVIIKNPVVQTSLIGVCPRAISVEVSRDAVNQTLLDLICDDIMRYIEGVDLPVSKTTYEVHDLLAKSEISTVAANKLVNFSRSSYGFYPILVGENSYKEQTNYLGFKSYNIKRTKI